VGAGGGESEESGEKLKQTGEGENQKTLAYIGDSQGEAQGSGGGADRKTEKKIAEKEPIPQELFLGRGRRRLWGTLQKERGNWVGFRTRNYIIRAQKKKIFKDTQRNSTLAEYGLRSSTN